MLKSTVFLKWSLLGIISNRMHAWMGTWPLVEEPTCPGNNDDILSEMNDGTKIDKE